ncbi:MAG: hypothetical protein AB202_03115 [Parcubacteria bacterium C7867-007]|nr:MAG: hypothetical protein AB202_03115 [Parcubacteria bacterium C7867-007]
MNRVTIVAIVSAFCFLCGVAATIYGPYEQSVQGGLLFGVLGIFSVFLGLTQIWSERFKLGQILVLIPGFKSSSYVLIGLGSICIGIGVSEILLVLS